MSLEIVFSTEAIDTLISTTLFIKHNWGNTAAEKFKKRVDKVLSNISKQPYIFKASDFDINIRHGFVTKQCSFYYYIHTDNIQILFFWDNRQQPIFDI